MSFQVGRKILIVNDPAQAQLLFYAQLASGIKNLVESDDDFSTGEGEALEDFGGLLASPDTQANEGSGYNPVTPSSGEGEGTVGAQAIAKADFLRIVGFADLVGADIVEVSGAKAVSGVKQVSKIAITASAPVAGEEFIVDISFKSDDFRGEFASHLSDYKKLKSIVVTSKSGDTASAVSDRIIADIRALKDSGWAALVDASKSTNDVLLTSTDPAVQFDVRFRGSAVDSGKLTAVHSVETPGKSGRGNHAQLKGLRLETVLCPYGEEHKIDQVPLKGAQYSQYVIKKRVSRPDLAGLSGGLNEVPTGDFELQIFINEKNTDYISDLTTWLNANAPNRTMYDASDVATFVAAVDSSAPYTSPLT